MTEELKNQLDLIYKEHINQLDIILIEHRENQSKESYKREFERFSKKLINKQVDFNESNDLDTDKYLVKLQNKSKAILDNFFS